MSVEEFQMDHATLTAYHGPGGDVTLPDAIRSIGPRAFLNCTALTGIHLPDGLRTIRDDAFSGCENLVHVRIPKGLMMIGNDVFRGCKSLKSIVIPDFVPILGWPVFPDCDSLTRITAPYLPSSFFDTEELRTAAALGYTEHPELYTDPKTVESLEYYLLARRSLTLPVIFTDDLVPALAFYAEHGEITDQNFDPDYLSPAVGAGAAQCSAFLLEWRRNHLPAASEWSLD